MLYSRRQVVEGCYGWCVILYCSTPYWVNFLALSWVQCLVHHHVHKNWPILYSCVVSHIAITGVLTAVFQAYCLVFSIILDSSCCTLVGKWVVEVLHRGEQAPGSPYTVNVIKPPAVKLYNLQSGVIGEQLSFMGRLYQLSLPLPLSLSVCVKLCFRFGVY